MSVVSFAVFCGILTVTDTTVTHSSVNLLSKVGRHKTNIITETFHAPVEAASLILKQWRTFRRTTCHKI